MAFRRRFRSLRRRRRPGPETWTVTVCRDETEVFQSMPCNDPLAIGQTIFTPVLPTGATDPTTAGAVAGEKAKTILGIKFQLEHSTDPGTWLDGDCGTPVPSQLAFLLTIFEALVVLPLQTGSKTLPAYLPRLNMPEQSFDVADRVLWKRVSIMPMWGLNAGVGGPQLQTTIRDTASGPQRVKARCRIDDRHGLFYCRTFVHDVVLTLNNECQIPVLLDGWFKIFYRVSGG